MIEYINKEVARRIIDSGRTKEQMLAVLSSATPADVREDKHGKWIIDDQIIFCPFCKESWDKPIHTSVWNFCPNCGAEMRKER